MNIFNEIKLKDNKIRNDNWIKWIHSMVPDEPVIIRFIVQALLLALGHCFMCTELSGCCFLESNMPDMPKHPYCDCVKSYIDKKELEKHATAQCDIRKFKDYIFAEGYGSHGKKTIFESWGYTTKDSELLCKELEKQAIKSYLNGNYILKNDDYNGQRIAISICLKGNYFYSGWIVAPNGKLINTTPFGGWVNE